MDADGIIHSEHLIKPCYEDVVTYTIGHNDYDDNKPVLIDAEDPNNFVTLSSARHVVRSFVAALKYRDIGPGKTVCLHTYNHILFPLLFLAVIGTGAQATAANPAYTAAELKHHFLVSDTALVVTTEEKRATVLEATKDIDALAGSWLPTLDELIRDAASRRGREWVRFDSPCLANSVACLNSTSGTTGLPKMAARSHYSLVMENLAIKNDVDMGYPLRRLLCTPFFHAFTLPLAVIDALRHGVPTYVMQRFDRARYLSAIDAFDITETTMPPPMILRFFGKDAGDVTPLKKVRKVLTGGAPLKGATQNAALGLIADGGSITQVWGMTEGGWMTTFLDPVKDTSGSVGRLIATYSACIVDPDDPTRRIKKPYHTGEVWVRGPINMLGYYKNEKATRSTMTHDGWLRTGDIGCVDEVGRLFVVDRAKDLIKVRGWQVSPAELEARLLTHPSIADAAVIGIAKPDLASEVPRAYIVPHRPGSLTVDVVKHHLLESLARYKVGECEVIFVHNIPKSPSGKILKRVLREEAALDDMPKRADSLDITHTSHRAIFADVPGKTQEGRAIST